MVFAFEDETMYIDLVINTNTLKIHDLNNNKYPDTGEISTVLGTLYNADTQNEIGSYRTLFVWGALDNSTGQAPVSLGTQVFDIKNIRLTILV